MQAKAILAALLLLGAAESWASEISGVTRENGIPLAGVKIKLLKRGDSTFSAADGTFRLAFSASAVRPSTRNAPAPAVLEGLQLVFHAVAGEDVRLDLFGLHGKRLAGRRYRPQAAGSQRLDLSALIGHLQGLGWLRVKAGGRTDWIGVLGAGPALRTTAVAGRQPRGDGESRPAVAPRVAAEEAIDSLLVEKPGYYSLREPLFDSPSPAVYGFTLWKNYMHGMDTAEVRAWKEHLQRPAQVLAINWYAMELPRDRTAGAFILQDGREVESWSTDPCRPQAPPKALFIAYVRGGRENRDTVRLDSLWKFQESFGFRADSLGPYHSRFSMRWDWRESFSVVPERDWMAVEARTALATERAVSHPDVFQVGVRMGIEGGVTQHGQFDPRSGRWILDASSSAHVGFEAMFTLARRDDHDLRLHLIDPGLRERTPDFAFAAVWPVQGAFPGGQALRLEARSEPAVKDAILEMVISGFEDNPVRIADHWDGNALDWKFPYPVLDTVKFRLRAKEYPTKPCPASMVSPELRVVRDPADTEAAAFEPNDSRAQAFLVPKGQWLHGAWDFGEPDPDHFRFRAARGERIRFTFRNPNGDMYDFSHEFNPDDVGITPQPGQETSRIYEFSEEGEYHFNMHQNHLPAGRYSFRLDTVE